MDNEKAGFRIAFNRAAGKVVNYDEFRKKKLDLEWQNFTWKDHLFQAFVDAPSRVFLWVGRAFAEAKDQVMGTPRDANAGYSYFDTLAGDVRGDIYFDRNSLESDLAFFQKRGLGRTFQQKSAAIARQAFDESRDFRVLVETGQLQKFEI